VVKEIRPGHVAIYIRWSTEDQGEGTTLAVQMEACRHYVASQGWEHRDDLIFIDDGFSGGSLDRPALTRLRRLVQAGEVDCVVVFKIDRLSRSVIDTVTLVLQEWEDLTYLKSAREPVDTTTAMGKQFFYMLVSYAEWERNIIRERTFSGKLRRAKDGRTPGFPAAYGYRKGPTPGCLALVEEEARVVRLIFALAEQGGTVRGITRHLNDRGYRTRKGMPWGTSIVSKVLHNPVYTGRLVWGRTRINPRWKKAPGEARVKRADPYVDRATENIPLIVSQEQFDRVQQRMSDNQQIGPAAAGSAHLLTGLLQCRGCGRAMQYNACRQWAYYRCSGKHDQNLCAEPAVPAPPLDDALIDALRARYEAEAGRRAEALLARGKGQPHDLEANIEAVTGQIARMQSQERRINQDYRQQRLTAGERRQLLADVEAERSDLQRVLADLNRLLSEARAGMQVLTDGLSMLQTADHFRPLPAAQQKQILRCFIPAIRAGKSEPGVLTLTVVWHGDAEGSSAH
jgi:site-specific DNA recombinase